MWMFVSNFTLALWIIGREYNNSLSKTTQELVFLHNIILVKQMRGLCLLDCLRISPKLVIFYSLLWFGKLGIISMLPVKSWKENHIMSTWPTPNLWSFYFASIYVSLLSLRKKKKVHVIEDLRQFRNHHFKLKTKQSKTVPPSRTEII